MAEPPKTVALKLDPQQKAEIKAMVKRVEERVVAKVKKVEDRLAIQERMLGDAERSLSFLAGFLNNQAPAAQVLAISELRASIRKYLDELEPFVIDMEQIEEEAMKENADQS